MNKSLLTNLLALCLVGLGFIVPVFAHEVKTMGLYSLSGALTNWLAVHMLFEKIPFLYGSGIVTERFEDFKAGIRHLIMTQFFTLENFERFMSGNKQSLIQIEEDAVVGAIDFDKVFNKLKEAIIESPFGGMLNMFGGAAALDPLRPQVETKFKEIIHGILNDEKFLSTLTQKGESNESLMNSVSSIVEQRLDELTPEMVKKIIQDMIKQHLGWLVVWGGVFGALIGLLSTFISF